MHFGLHESAQYIPPKDLELYPGDKSTQPMVGSSSAKDGRRLVIPAEADHSDPASFISSGTGCMIGDMVADTDGHQIVVSTTGEQVKVDSLVSGIRAVQFVGSVSDESLQLYFQTRAGRL
jgi:hypothetical protein